MLSKYTKGSLESSNIKNKPHIFTFVAAVRNFIRKREKVSYLRHIVRRF